VSDGRSTAASIKTTASEAARTPQSQGSARPSDETATKEASSFERLVRSIRLQTGPRNSSARLQLHPPELGRLRVDVRLAGDQIEIDVRTETDAARDFVSRRSDELKTALEQHGIQVNRFDVTVRSVPEQPAGTASYDGSAVTSDAQRNPSWTSGRRRSGEDRTDDTGSSAAMRAASSTAAVAEARLDIRV
jgi:flagellar hook-length control protein FliK